MSIFAIDQKGIVTSATTARKGENYYCRECKGAVGLRGGAQRRRHFFHLQSQEGCSSSGKGKIHNAAQCAIFSSLPKGEIELERAFPEIGRIADIAWEKERIIFEVQVSAITAKEVATRNADYASVGWQVVWLLHTVRYGKEELTPAEMWLRAHAHFYCNFDEEGKGEVLDRLIFGSGTQVIAEKWVGPLDLGAPIQSDGLLRFKGDGESCLSADKELALELMKWKRLRRHRRWSAPLYRIYDRFLRRPFLTWLHLQMESAARR